MIRTIWSRCVRATWRMAGRRASSGTLLTASLSEPISAMEQRLLAQPRVNRTDSVRFAWWGVKHRLGLHTMIEHEEWDFIEEVVTPKGLICWICGYEL